MCERFASCYCSRDSCKNAWDRKWAVLPGCQWRLIFGADRGGCLDPTNLKSNKRLMWPVAVLFWGIACKARNYLILHAWPYMCHLHSVIPKCLAMASSITCTACSKELSATSLHCYFIAIPSCPSLYKEVCFEWGCTWLYRTLLLMNIHILQSSWLSECREGLKRSLHICIIVSQEQCHLW